MIHKSPRSPIHGNNKVQMWTDQVHKKSSWQINQVSLCSQPLCCCSCELAYSKVWGMPICLPNPWWNIKGLSTVLASTRKHCCFSRPPVEEIHNSACMCSSPRDHQEVLVCRCIQLSKNSSACLFRKKEGKCLWDEYVSLFALVPKCGDS